MELILLGGNSPKNEDWIEEMSEKIADEVAETHVQYYDHWESGGEIQLDAELEKLQSLVRQINGEYAIFAKSAGVVLALDAIQANEINPEKCIFVGSPIGVSAAERFENFRTPTLFIHQTDDPIRSARKVRNILQNHNVKHYVFQEVPGDDHIYEDTDTLAEFVSEFLNK